MQNNDFDKVSGQNPEYMTVQSSGSQISRINDQKSSSDLQALAAKLMELIPHTTLDEVHAIVDATFTGNQIEYPYYERLLKTEAENEFRNELQNRAKRVEELLKEWGFPASSLQISSTCFELFKNALIMRLVTEQGQVRAKKRIRKNLLQLDAYITSLKPLTVIELTSPSKCGEYVDMLFRALLQLAHDF